VLSVDARQQAPVDHAERAALQHLLDARDAPDSTKILSATDLPSSMQNTTPRSPALTGSPWPS